MRSCWRKRDTGPPLRAIQTDCKTLSTDSSSTGIIHKCYKTNATWWYCFFPIQGAADRENWHDPTALISISHWLVTLLPGLFTHFWPHPPCTLDRNLAFPTKCLRSQSKKKEKKRKVDQRTSPRLWYAAWGSTAQLVLIWQSLLWVEFISSLSKRQLPQFGRVKPLHGGGVLELEKAKFGVCSTANIGFEKVSWALY